MKPSTANSSHSRFAILPGDHSFFALQLPSCRIFAEHLPSSRVEIRFNIFPYSFESILSDLHRCIKFGPSLCRVQHEHFLNKIKASPCRSSLLTMSCPPTCDMLHLPRLCLESSRSHLGPSHFSLYLHVLAASSASRAPVLPCGRTPLGSMLPCLSFFFTKNQLFFWLRSKLLHNPSIFPPDSESQLHIARLRELLLYAAGQCSLTPASESLHPTSHLPLQVRQLSC